MEEVNHPNLIIHHPDNTQFEKSIFYLFEIVFYFLSSFIPPLQLLSLHPLLHNHHLLFCSPPINLDTLASF